MIPLSNSRSTMAISSANIISRTAMQLQCQALLIPSVKKNVKMATLRCSRRRDYSSSVPVRYIPKKSLGNKESETSPSSGLDVVKIHTTSSLDSNGADFMQELRLGPKVRNQNGNLVNHISSDAILDSGRVAELNVPSIGISDRVQTSGSSRSVVPDAESQYYKERENPDIGLDASKIVRSNIEETEPSNGERTSSSIASFAVGTEFQNHIRKPTSNLKANVESNTIRVSGSNVDRHELSKPVQSSCSGRSFVVGNEFLNENEKPVDNFDCDVPSAANRAVRSNMQSSEVSKNVQTTCSSRSYAGDAEFLDQKELPINSITNDIGLGTRVFQSNEQKVELSNRAQTSNSSRVCVVDNKFQNLSAKRIDYDTGFGVGEELDEHMLYMEEHEGFAEQEGNRDHKIQGSQVKKDVEKFAVELLATRAYTTVELRKKLLGKEFSVQAVDALITDFQDRGFINDGLYAETFSRSRWASSTWGPRRIKKALYSKGLGVVDTEKAIKLVFDDNPACGHEESGLDISNRSMDHLFSQASKQWLRSCGVPTETRKSRIVRWLQYRGFSWSVINFVLKKLESHYPS